MGGIVKAELVEKCQARILRTRYQEESTKFVFFFLAFAAFPGGLLFQKYLAKLREIDVPTRHDAHNSAYAGFTC